MMINHLIKIYTVYHSVFSFGLASLLVTVDVSNSKMEEFFSESRGERVKRGFVKMQFLLFLSLPHSSDFFSLHIPDKTPNTVDCLYLIFRYLKVPVYVKVNLLLIFISFSIIAIL